MQREPANNNSIDSRTTSKPLSNSLYIYLPQEPCRLPTYIPIFVSVLYQVFSQKMINSRIAKIQIQIQYHYYYCSCLYKTLQPYRQCYYHNSPTSRKKSQTQLQRYPTLLHTRGNVVNKEIMSSRRNTKQVSSWLLQHRHMVLQPSPVANNRYRHLICYFNINLVIVVAVAVAVAVAIVVVAKVVVVISIAMTSTILLLLPTMSYY